MATLLNGTHQQIMIVSWSYCRHRRIIVIVSSFNCHRIVAVTTDAITLLSSPYCRFRHSIFNNLIAQLLLISISFVIVVVAADSPLIQQSNRRQIVAVTGNAITTSLSSPYLRYCLCNNHIGNSNITINQLMVPTIRGDANTEAEFQVTTWDTWRGANEQQ